MSAPHRALVVQPRFMDRLFDIQQYEGRNDASRGRNFVAALFDFIYDIIGPHPLAFPAFILPRHPGLVLRRAVFRRKHILLYEVTDSETIMLTVFSANQNLAEIDL